MATKAEVEFWKDKCRKLTAALDRSIKDKDELTARLWDNSEEAKTARAVADGLEWRVEELEVENARLREDLEDQEGYDQMLRDRLRQQTELCVKAEADNAKLRELVTDMYRCSDPCNDCQHYSGSNTGYYCGLGIGWKARRMRELGIEVDG